MVGFTMMLLWSVESWRYLYTKNIYKHGMYLHGWLMGQLVAGCIKRQSNICYQLQDTKSRSCTLTWLLTRFTCVFVPSAGQPQDMRDLQKITWDSIFET